ncbi:gamma-mobile-trio protein GmtX [Vibrio splendidus]|uniref:gamma-mobile-trio protein GmtX n=1 Tax=Vibrio splendidus TaxID=29497 RepID=UPI00076A58B2|nr:gamma-mobile-trio protein GmtX [Vibrio splendidus]PHX07622.1 hypothetical protein VSPL_05600 [Vibrio splendidus]
MKGNSILTKKDVEDLYKSLEASTSRGAVKSTLKHVNEICSKMVEVKVTPTVAAVVKALASKGVIVSKRTIYNKRKGENPYPILIEAWGKVAHGQKLNFENVVRTATEPNSQIIETKGLFTDEDLLNIQDPVLRYKITVLYGQASSLKKQNSVLRKIRELPSINPDHQVEVILNNEKSLSHTENNQLDKFDIEILSNFLKNQRAKGLEFDSTGALWASTAIRRGSILSDPGLKEVIEKILQLKL